jgi:hypothetical protein
MPDDHGLAFAEHAHEPDHVADDIEDAVRRDRGRRLGASGATARKPAAASAAS